MNGKSIPYYEKLITINPKYYVIPQKSLWQTRAKTERIGC